MFKKDKPQIGYKSLSHKEKKKIKKSERTSSLFVQGSKKITIIERIIKSIIYIVLRMVIKPSKWKEPEKNYLIIDRAYKRIMSADFIFIPSSIAFYLIMAFMPVLSMITFLYLIPGISPWMESKHAGPEAIGDILGKFIPGANSIFKELASNLKNGTTKGTTFFATFFSFAISTWIAAGGFSKLVFTQSYVYEHKFTGGYWANKTKGIFMVMTFTSILIFSLIVNILFTGWIKSYNMEKTKENIIEYAFLVTALFVGMIMGFAILFKFSPRFKIKFKHILPGSFVAGIPTGIFLAAFGPITTTWSYGSYGAIGAVMYIGMASLFITNFIFIGLAVNAAYYKTFVSLRMRSKWTFSNK